jgi:hypothetical protein
MIVDANNRMIGRSEHIRSIGPHEHAWAARGADPLGGYRECEACGARAYTGPAEFAARRAWLAGGDWDIEAEVPTGADPAVVAEEMRAMRASQRDLPREYREMMGEPPPPPSPPPPASPPVSRGVEQPEAEAPGEKRIRK